MAVKRFKKAFIEFILSNYIIIGDFNIDFLHPEHRIFSKLLCILNSFDLTQVVPSDTHTSHNGKNTLIDLALISLSSKLKKCSVIPPLSKNSRPTKIHSGTLHFLFFLPSTLFSSLKSLLFSLLSCILVSK